MSDDSLRLDKWLWYARFFKTRTLAARICNGGQVRCGGSRVSKAHQQVRAGDVLTFPQGRYIRIVKVIALGAHRGTAVEARVLYEDLGPPETALAVPEQLGMDPRPAGAGRPTKRDRRMIDKLRESG